MQVTDPKSLLELVDLDKFNMMRSHPAKQENLVAPTFEEPVPMPDDTSTAETFKLLGNDGGLPKSISGRIQRFGNNVDTDTVLPLFTTVI
jgi:homoaconitate hydratase